MGAARAHHVTYFKFVVVTDRAHIGALERISAPLQVTPDDSVIVDITTIKEMSCMYSMSALELQH